MRGGQGEGKVFNSAGPNRAYTSVEEATGDDVVNTVSSGSGLRGGRAVSPVDFLRDRDFDSHNVLGRGTMW